MNLLNKLNNLKSPKKNGMELFTGIVNKNVDISVKKVEAEDIPDVSFNIFSRKDTKDNNPAATTGVTKNETAQSLVKTHPTIENLVPNSDAQIRLNLAHDAALGVLNDSIGMLRDKLDDIEADKLPSVIAATSKVVESIRRERLESSKTKDREVHYHFYTPEQKSIEQYEVIDVG